MQKCRTSPERQRLYLYLPFCIAKNPLKNFPHSNTDTLFKASCTFTARRSQLDTRTVTTIKNFFSATEEL